MRLKVIVKGLNFRPGIGKPGPELLRVNPAISDPGSRNPEAYLGPAPEPDNLDFLTRTQPGTRPFTHPRFQP